MSVVFYLAWVNEGVTFSAGTHATTACKIWDGAEGGEIVFSIEIEQSEGEFASLTAELRNPRVGLLSAGRNQWIWLSADDGGGPEPLFNGRIVGVPEQLQNEVVSVQFVARPPDFIAQKESVAESLRVLPWFDRAFLQERLDDPDTVLESYPLRYHIDAVTLAVSVSDIIAGEDGTIEIDGDNHFYDGINVSYGDPPLRRVALSLTVSWTQTGAGDIDLTRQMVQAFGAVGSPYPEPFVASLTGGGLFEDWPAPLSDIGGGWTIAANSAIEPATWMQPKAYVVNYGDRSGDFKNLFGTDPIGFDPTGLIFGTPRNAAAFVIPGSSPPADATALDAGDDPFGNWEAAFELGIYALKPFAVHYDAARDRSETVTASVEADVQPLLVDPGADETDTIELSSDVIGEPIDPDLGSPGAFDMPIGDLRRNTYFKTDRGAQSLQYGLLLARAKILSRSRAVNLKVTTPWSVANGITCRMNGHVVDYRLPGGEATGKVITYRRTASGEDAPQAEITLGCTIGYGVALGPPAAGTPAYVEDGYVNDNYQQRTGADVELIAGVLQYESLDDFAVTDDDGVDLFNLRPATAVNSLVVTNGPNAQRAAIDIQASLPATAAPDPVAALEAAATTVALDLVPVDGGAFHVDYAVEVSEIVVPQTIDLEAA
jgi:hypothetical protein